MVERHHGGIGPLEELWRPGQLAKDVAGKSLVGGMLLERVGSAALLYLLVASTPCMGGLLCAPSGEVGRRGNFCMLCILCFHRRRHRYGRLHRPAVFIKGQMSDSLGAAPLAQFAPASLTSTPPGTGTGMETEEAARQCTALAMILKSRAHTAACKLRRRGCCGSASSTALHGARIIVHTLTTTQSSHPW